MYTREPRILSRPFLFAAIDFAQVIVPWLDDTADTSVPVLYLGQLVLDVPIAVGLAAATNAARGVARVSRSGSAAAALSPTLALNGSGSRRPYTPSKGGRAIAGPPMEGRRRRSGADAAAPPWARLGKAACSAQHVRANQLFSGLWRMLPPAQLDAFHPLLRDECGFNEHLWSPLACDLPPLTKADVNQCFNRRDINTVSFFTADSIGREQFSNFVQFWLFPQCATLDGRAFKVGGGGGEGGRATHNRPRMNPPYWHALPPSLRTLCRQCIDCVNEIDIPLPSLGPASARAPASSNRTLRVLRSHPGAKDAFFGDLAFLQFSTVSVVCGDEGSPVKHDFNAWLAEALDVVAACNVALPPERCFVFLNPTIQARHSLLR